MARSLQEIMADAPEVSQGALERPKARSLSQIIADAPAGDGTIPPNRMDSLDNILRDMDEKTAKNYENSLTGSLAFRQEPETYLRNSEKMEKAIADSPYHKQTRDEAKEFYRAISNLHYGVAPETHDAEAFSTLEIREIARLYNRKGLITDEELEKALADEAPAGTFFNPEGRYTREHPPAPKYFYDKSWVERAKETPQSIAGGVNHSISGFFRGVEWLQGETGVNVGAKGVATWFEENAAVATTGVRADFMTDLWGAVGSMMTLVVPAGGVGAVGRMAGLAKGWALALEMSTASVAEALMEAGGSYNNIINKGGSIQDAKEGARFSFGSNLALLLVSNRLGIYKARYDALRRGTKAPGAVVRTAKAGVGGFAAEFTQEAGQAVIGQLAEGEEISWSEAAYNGFIGGIVGAGTSALMATAAQKIEAIPELSPETQKIYQDTMNQALLQGVPQEAANIAATQRIAETEDGAKVLKKVMEAQEAVIEAEAAMGEDVTLPVGLEEIDLAEVDARIESGEITEEQAEAEILQRLAAPPEASGLLGEEGAIDLDAEISLAPVLEKLRSFRENPAQGLEDLTNIGRSIWAEGRTEVEDFTARMREVLGDLWADFKDFARQAWEIVANERGEITLTPEGKPEFDTAIHFDNIRFQTKEGKLLPSFMEDHAEWSEDEVNLALDRAHNGRPITEREAEIVHAALAEAGANFYQAVMESEGAFIDPKDLLEEGELDAIIEQGINDFVSKLTVTKAAKPLTAEQKAKKERTKEFTRRGKEIDRLQSILEDKVELLHDRFIDNTKLRRLGKEQTEAAKKEKGQLESRVATRDKQLAALKDRTRDAIQAARAFIKGRTGAELAATRAAEIQGDPATRAAIKTALQAVRKAKPAIKKEVARKESARVREIFETARGKRETTARRQQLRKAIKKELRTAKPKKQAGKPVGQFTPEIQNVLDQLRTAAAMNTTEALEKINANLADYQDMLPPDNIALENRIISMAHDFGTRTVPQLETLLEDIRALKDEGKMINELRKFNRQAQTEKAVADAVFVLTGGKGLPEGADARTRKANYDRMQGTPDRAKQWLSSQGLALVGWKDILDILSRLDKTSKPFQSKLSELGDVLDTKNAEKDGVREYMDNMQAMYREAFDIASDRAGNREMMNRMRADSEVIDLGLFFDLEGRRVPLEISKAEARKRYMEFRDPTLDASFTEGMAYTPEMKKAIMEQLSPEDIAFAEAQMAFYQEYYTGINEVYRDMYGVDLPQNPNYSPVRREGFGRDKGVGFGAFLEELNLRVSVAPSAVKDRVDNILPIKPQSDVAILEQHMSEMEHFKAWAERTKELRAIFDNTEVRAAIETFHDPKILGVVENFMADFIRGGVDTSKNMDKLDKWRVNMARSVLAIKPSIGIKQLTSFIAYADAMPVDQFVKYSAEFWKNPIENGKMLKRDSTLLRERGEHMERDIRDANRSDEFSAWRLNPSFMNALMLNIKAGDQGAIMAGGWPLYKYHRDMGKTHEEAIRIFESVTESTQQSADLSELSTWQRGNSFAKLFTTYKSSPNQYFRKEVGALRNFIHGRQGVAQTAKTVIIFHMLLPMFFQWVSDGFEWDEDEQIRAMVLGPLNGIFIAGDLIEAAVRSAVGLRDFDDELPMMSVVDGVIRAVGLIKDDDITTEDFIRATRAIAETGGHITGLPLKTGIDIGTGVVDLFSGDFEKGAYEVLGWSPYVAKKAAEDEEEEKKRRRRR